MVYYIQKYKMIQEGTMKRLFLGIGVLALLLCACETKLPVQTTDTQPIETTAVSETTVAPETTAAPETTTAPETTVVPETTAAPETTVPVTTKAPETTAESIIIEPVAYAYAVPILKYENDDYIVTEYRNSDSSVIYWTVVTKSISHPQEFRYDCDKSAGPIPSVTTLVAEEDINFDGRTDLCLFMGYFGVQGTRRYRGYLQNEEGTYTLCEEFENIANPVLDAENKVILSGSRENAAQHWYGKYAFDGETVKCIDKLIYTVGDGIVEMDGVVYSVAAGSADHARFLGDGGEWDLDNNAKWGQNVLGKR